MMRLINPSTWRAIIRKESSSNNNHRQQRLCTGRVNIQSLLQGQWNSFSTTTTTTAYNDNNQKMIHQVPRYYSLALTRNVPQSFPKALSKQIMDGNGNGTNGIDLERAKQQHAFYVQTLTKFIPTLCLSALENQHYNENENDNENEEYPDSVFVEDTVVSIGKRQAILTHPGHPSRRGEVDSIKHVLQDWLGFSVLDMRNDSLLFDNDNGTMMMRNQNENNNKVLCDGGDVLFTTRHLFVGLSDRTNERAVSVLAKAFASRNIPVIPITFCNDEALHLKSIVTYMDPTTLVAPQDSLGDDVVQAMKAHERGYEVIRLPSRLACNVVSVNGGILAQDGNCPISREILERAANERKLQLEFVNLSEFAKCDGAPTCCSVLLEL